MITITLIGAGNVAKHLFKAFEAAPTVSVTQWYSRSKDALSDYKNKVQILDSIENIIPTTVTIIAVSDDAIAKVSRKIPHEGHLVVHTSGSVGVHDLDAKHERGVFYPLQTFSHQVAVDFSNIPICYEAISKPQRVILKNLAATISTNVQFITTDQRQTLHLSAVFVNNFTNHLYRIAHEISDAKQIDFDLLKPLILETAKKMDTLSPFLAQTGPAKRRDKKTLKRHLNGIENQMHKDIYNLLTASIQNTHGR